MVDKVNLAVWIAFVLVGLAGIVVLNIAVLGMAKDLRSVLPAQSDKFRWYRVLRKGTGGSDVGVSSLYLEHYGKDGRYIKLARNGWRLVGAGFGLAALSSLFAVLR